MGHIAVLAPPPHDYVLYRAKQVTHAASATSSFPHHSMHRSPTDADEETVYGKSCHGWVLELTADSATRGHEYKLFVCHSTLCIPYPETFFSLQRVVAARNNLENNIIKLGNPKCFKYSLLLSKYVSF